LRAERLPITRRVPTNRIHEAGIFSNPELAGALRSAVTALALSRSAEPKLMRLMALMMPRYAPSLLALFTERSLKLQFFGSGTLHGWFSKSAAVNGLNPSHHDYVVKLGSPPLVLRLAQAAARAKFCRRLMSAPPSAVEPPGGTRSPSFWWRIWSGIPPTALAKTGILDPPTADRTLLVQSDRLPTSDFCVNSPCSSSSTAASRGVGTTLTQ
jgi:hypothetical protein